MWAGAWYSTLFLEDKLGQYENVQFEHSVEPWNCTLSVSRGTEHSTGHVPTAVYEESQRAPECGQVSENLRVS